MLSNGVLFPAAALALVLPVFLPVAVAVLAGDAVAGEATAGTLRYLLVRPVARTRLLVAKLVAIDRVHVPGGASWWRRWRSCAGAWLFGVKPLSSVSGSTTHRRRTLALAHAVTIGYVALSMLGLAAIALFASTLTDSPLAAALGALAALRHLARCST